MKLDAACQTTSHKDIRGLVKFDLAKMLLKALHERYPIGIIRKININNLGQCYSVIEKTWNFEKLLKLFLAHSDIKKIWKDLAANKDYRFFL